MATGEPQVATYPGLLHAGGGRWTFDCHRGPRADYDRAGALGRLWRLGVGWVDMEHHRRFSEPEQVVAALKADLLDLLVLDLLLHVLLAAEYSDGRKCRR